MNNSLIYNLPKDFNWKKYLEINKDLPRNFSSLEAKNHFLNYGMKENRIYKFQLPDDFNWINYLKLNTDLPKNYGEIECKEHFTKFGKLENRNSEISEIIFGKIPDKLGVYCKKKCLSQLCRH